MHAGENKESGKHEVRLVDGTKLAEKQAQLAGDNEALIYAVAPRKQASDALGLHVQGMEQARELMKGVVQGSSDRSVCSPLSCGTGLGSALRCARACACPSCSFDLPGRVHVLSLHAHDTLLQVLALAY